MRDSTLHSRIKKNTEINAKYSSKYICRQVFASEQETLMKEYILKSAKMCYGLTYSQIRKMAYDYANFLTVNIRSPGNAKKPLELIGLRGP